MYVYMYIYIYMYIYVYIYIYVYMYIYICIYIYVYIYINMICKHNISYPYPPEVRRGDYWGLGVFLLQYFPLVKMWTLLHYNCISMYIVG